MLTVDTVYRAVETDAEPRIAEALAKDREVHGIGPVDRVRDKEPAAQLAEFEQLLPGRPRVLGLLRLGAFVNRVDQQAHGERPAASGTAQTARKRVVDDALLRARMFARRLRPADMADRRLPLEGRADQLSAARTLDREAVDAGEETERTSRQLVYA